MYMYIYIYNGYLSTEIEVNILTSSLQRAREGEGAEDVYRHTHTYR